MSYLCQMASFKFHEEGHVSNGLSCEQFSAEEFPACQPTRLQPYTGNRNEAFAAAAAANIPYNVVTGGEGTPIDRGSAGHGFAP